MTMRTGSMGQMTILQTLPTQVCCRGESISLSVAGLSVSAPLTAPPAIYIRNILFFPGFWVYHLVWTFHELFPLN